jgi:cell division protein FtsB
VSGGGPGAHTTARHGQGVARAVAWCGRLLVAIRLIFGLHLVSGKIGILAFVLSNSEIILCVAFLKHKNNKNRELALWNLVNRLVL